MPLEVIENITRVEADNRERKASAEAKAKQIVADAATYQSKGGRLMGEE